MGAHVSYNGEQIHKSDRLLFMFECKFCHERWFSQFCMCPRCKKVRKFKILSGEQFIQTMKDNHELQQMAVYALLMNM